MFARERRVWSRENWDESKTGKGGGKRERDQNSWHFARSGMLATQANKHNHKKNEHSYAT